MAAFGEFLGKRRILKRALKKVFYVKKVCLKQKIAGIEFDNPTGLAAGFDYETKLTQILPSIGFGFETVGTITNSSYEGNPEPRLGRLPKSQSLMVNKGFKNFGAPATAEKFKNMHFEIPVGISIGRTNSPHLDQEKSIADIVSAFKIFERAEIRHSYYELNISCPNLYGNVTFYMPENLNRLLAALKQLKIKRPVFVKMPTSRSDKEVEAMLDIIAEFKLTGVIFGNLQKDKMQLHPEERNLFSVGSFSGKPAQRRSDELIKSAYKKYGKKLVIIGCGGIFNAQDAYKKIKLGASLVQLITGLIYEGPQLVAQINSGLAGLLKKDGFKHIQEAVGVDD